MGRDEPSFCRVQAGQDLDGCEGCGKSGGTEREGSMFGALLRYPCHCERLESGCPSAKRRAEGSGGVRGNRRCRPQEGTSCPDDPSNEAGTVKCRASGLWGGPIWGWGDQVPVPTAIADQSGCELAEHALRMRYRVSFLQDVTGSHHPPINGFSPIRHGGCDDHL